MYALFTNLYKFGPPFLLPQEATNCLKASSSGGRGGRGSPPTSIREFFVHQSTSQWIYENKSLVAEISSFRNTNQLSKGWNALAVQHTRANWEPFNDRLETAKFLKRSQPWWTFQQQLVNLLYKNSSKERTGVKALLTSTDTDLGEINKKCSRSKS